ncbi:MAG TPA: prephenate dehydratase [Acidimicrobiia bacterium]|nr:prephenate dehydratase [Acidimicrobiia bacterium]
MAQIAFLGPPGTFTEEALLSQRDLAGGELLPMRSVPDVIAAVERGDADLGIVPIENSIEGSVNVTLDALAFESELLVQREVVLSISLNLCARPGVHLGDVKTVISHPHATAQCRDWLAQKLPGVEVQAANSTAEAAQGVSRSRSAGRAAISTALAAELYGLDVLAADVEDHPENQTRFVVLGRGVPPRTGHDKTTVVVFQSQDRPGSLLGILQEFAARAVNLTKLESRPTKRGLGDYCFFIDCEGHIADELVADVLRNLAAKHTVKFLGSYPVSGLDGTGEARRKAAGKAWKAASAWVEQLRNQVRPGDGTA